MSYHRISNAAASSDSTLTYIASLKTKYASDISTLNRLIRLIRDAIRFDGHSNPVSSITSIAQILKHSPELLTGLNELLPTGYRLECCAGVEEVRYYVLATPSASQIYSTSPQSISAPHPSTSVDLQTLSQFQFERLLEGHNDWQWLACLSQLLQLELDHQELDSFLWRKYFRWLKNLAKVSDFRSYLPPSLFLHNITLDSIHPFTGGASADIYRGQYKGKTVCLKVFRMFENQPDAERKKVYQEFSREVLVSRQLHHPNILPFVGANMDLFPSRFCLVSLWMPNGNIMQFLSRHPDHDKLTSICEIVEAIRYLHTLNPPVAHKDIKGANILVNEANVCVLGDFGLSSVVESQSYRLNPSAPVGGSAYWLAPELIEMRLPIEQVAALPGDVYALACTIHEIYTGKAPFARRYNSAMATSKVLEGKRPHLPPKGYWTTQEEQIWNLVDQCWAQDPAHRPDVSYIDKTLKDISTSFFREQQSRPSSINSPIEISSSPWGRIKDKERRSLHELLDNELRALDVLANNNDISITTDCDNKTRPMPLKLTVNGTHSISTISANTTMPSPALEPAPQELSNSNSPKAQFIFGLATPRFEYLTSDGEIPSPMSSNGKRSHSRSFSMDAMEPNKPSQGARQYTRHGSIDLSVLPAKHTALPTPPMTPSSDGEVFSRMNILNRPMAPTSPISPTSPRSLRIITTNNMNTLRSRKSTDILGAKSRLGTINEFRMDEGSSSVAARDENWVVIESDAEISTLPSIPNQKKPLLPSPIIHNLDRGKSPEVAVPKFSTFKLLSLKPYCTPPGTPSSRSSTSSSSSPSSSSVYPSDSEVEGSSAISIESDFSRYSSDVPDDVLNVGMRARTRRPKNFSRLKRRIHQPSPLWQSLQLTNFHTDKSITGHRNMNISQ